MQKILLKNGLMVNEEKTKKLRTVVKRKGRTLKEIDSYKYLGTILEGNGKMLQRSCLTKCQATDDFNRTVFKDAYKVQNIQRAVVQLYGSAVRIAQLSSAYL